MHQVIQPPDWVRPKGYANGILAQGRQLFVGGQVGWNRNQEFETDDLVEQFRQALGNAIEVVRTAGGEPGHVVRMTWYLKDKREYNARLKELGTVYRDIMGRNFPAMSAVQVADLIEDRAKVEIEITAVIPELPR
jgi:enamine deaminase RidA (YjgF/YER057c/UK114 family)